jgi:branched-chain amino acid transport system substrate-binding protein
MGGPPPSTAGEPVKIGEINSYGAVPGFTMAYRNGWRMAVDEINASGGVLDGRPIEVVSRDDGGKLSQALAYARELVGKEGVSLIFGGVLSHVGAGLAAFAKENKIVFLAAETMTDDLVWSKGNRYTFHLPPGAYMQAAMLAEQAAKLPAKRWATVAPDFDFGRSVTENFETLLRRKRPDVQFVAQQWTPLGALDPEPVVAALGVAKPDAIFNATFGSDLAKLIRAGKAKDLFKKRTVVSVLTGQPELLDGLTADAPEGWLVTGYPWYDIASVEHRKFVEAYEAMFNEEPCLSALLGYVAIKAAVQALARAGDTDPEKLVTAFEDLTVASPVGPIAFRQTDHQATLGSWVGRIALKDGGGTMVDWVYDDGANYLPSPDDVRKWRPSE